MDGSAASDTISLSIKSCMRFDFCTPAVSPAGARVSPSRRTYLQEIHQCTYHRDPATPRGVWSWETHPTCCVSVQRPMAMMPKSHLRLHGNLTAPLPTFEKILHIPQKISLHDHCLSKQSSVQAVSAALHLVRGYRNVMPGSRHWRMHTFLLHHPVAHQCPA